MTLADQAHFGNYNPASFGWGDPRPTLVPLSFNGVNFGQCARDAHPVFMALLTELVPHIPGGLHAGSCWSWSTTDELPDGSHSFHWYGTAIDVNWNVNHMGQNIADPTGQYAIPRGPATTIAAKYGCEWGGNWSGGFHDDMHFEIHLSPSVARTVVPLTTQEFTVDAAAGKRFDTIDGRFKGQDGREWPIENLVLEVVKPLIAASEARIIAAIKAGK